MKLEISVRHLTQLGELKKRFECLSNLPKEEEEKLGDPWYIAEKAGEIYGLLEFLDNPKKYIEKLRETIEAAEMEVQTP